MDWKGAIQAVLQGISSPMHYSDIAQQIAEKGLRRDDELGATPANSVVATIVGSLKNDGAISFHPNCSRVLRIAQCATDRR
jgi:hypothetical protein